MKAKDFRHRVYQVDLNSVGPAIFAGLSVIHDETQIKLANVGANMAANMVHSMDAALHNATLNSDGWDVENTTSIIDYEIAVCGGGKLAQFARELRNEDTRLCYLWLYNADPATYTATQRDTLNRLANKVRASYQ